MHFTQKSVWRESGLKIELLATPDSGVGSRFLRITDLNPSAEIRNVMTRWEAIRLGAWLVLRALRPTLQT